MSSPWKFFGTWFPYQETMLDPGVTPIGSGTAYPLSWAQTAGTSGLGQICEFEWTVKEIAFSFSGSATCTFTNPTPGGMPPTAQATAPYSISASNLDSLGTTGTDWSVLEPPDIVSGGRTWTVSGTQTVPVTLPWPSTGEAIVFNCQVDVGNGQATAAIVGSSFATYTKGVRVAASANAAITTSNSSDFSSPVLLTSVSVLHGSVDMYDDSGAVDTMTISGSVSVASQFIQPPNI